MTQNIKVALLFIAAVAALLLIVNLLTGGAIRDAATLYVTYDFAGGVQKGTPVRVAGIQVGKVRQIEFIGDQADIDGHVRLTLHVDRKAMESVRTDSKFYINMAGIIGERYVEISTGSKDAPRLTDGQTVRGVDPPRLDQLISQGYGVAGKLLDIIEKNRPKIEKMIDALDSFLENFDAESFGDVATLVSRASSLVKSLDRDLPPVLQRAGPLMDEMQPVLKNANTTLSDLSPLLIDLRAVLGKMRGAFKDKDLASVIDQILGTIDRLESTLKGADTLVNNLTFMDENWLRHFLQVEGVKAYAGFGSPNIPKASEPVAPPPLRRPSIKQPAAAAAE